MQLHRTPIFGFHRGNLIVGCERNLFFLLMMICVVLVILQTIITTLIAALLWLTGIPLLRALAKADPLMSRIFLRYKKHPDFYPAHARKNYSHRD